MTTTTLERIGTITFDNWTTPSIGQIAPLYVRGTGFHQGGTRKVQVGSTSLIPTSQATSKGLGFLKIDRTTHVPIALSEGVTSVVLNTHASSADSTALAHLLDEVTESEIGILTSYDRFEGNVNEALELAAKRVGLRRLAQFVRGKRTSTDPSSKRAYAAVFSGASSQASVHAAWETFEASGENAPPAIISTFLIDGGFGSRSAPTELVSVDPNDAEHAAVVVDQGGHVGIGTRAPTEQLDVDGNVRVTGNLIGNVVGRASTAQSWTTPRTLTLAGDIAGNVVWDGSANVSMTTTLTSLSEKTVTVPSGGTGQTSHLQGSLLVGQGTDPLETYATLVWDETHDRLGVGTSTPTESLDVVGNVVVSETLAANLVEGKLDRAVTFVDGTQTVVGTFDNTVNVTVPVGSGINANIDATGAPEYNGFDPKDGSFYGGAIDPDAEATIRLNYQGPLYASEYHGSLAKTITFEDGEGTTVGTFDNTTDVTVPVGSGINANVDATGAPEYNGFDPKDGSFYGGTVDPDPESDLRLNYQGTLHASEYQGPLVGPDVTTDTVTCGTATVTELFTADRMVSNTLEGNSATFMDTVEANEFLAMSDALFKTNVKTIENAMDMVRNMRGVRYEWTDPRFEGPRIGVIAQELLEIVPEVVTKNAKGSYGVSYGNLLAVLIEALKNQDQRIQALETQLAT